MPYRSARQTKKIRLKYYDFLLPPHTYIWLCDVHHTSQLLTVPHSEHTQQPPLLGVPVRHAVVYVAIHVPKYIKERMKSRGQKPLNTKPDQSKMQLKSLHTSAPSGRGGAHRCASSSSLATGFCSELHSILVILEHRRTLLCPNFL